MNKVVLAGLALILVRDCDIGGPRFHGQIKGTWGGDNAGLMAFDTTAHVHIGCTAGHGIERRARDDAHRDAHGYDGHARAGAARARQGAADGAVPDLTVVSVSVTVSVI